MELRVSSHAIVSKRMCSTKTSPKLGQLQLPLDVSCCSSRLCSHGCNRRPSRKKSLLLSHGFTIYYTFTGSSQLPVRKPISHRPGNTRWGYK